MASSTRFFAVVLLLSLVLTNAVSRPDCYNDVCKSECIKKVGYAVNGCCANDECFCVSANSDCSEIFPPSGESGADMLIRQHVV